MTDTTERRMCEAAELRVQTNATGIATIEGYAATWDTLSVDLGFGREIVKRGAFSRSLRENPDIRALVNHDMSKVIGRTVAGTLEVKEDQRGLFVRIKPPNTQTGNDVVELIRRGDIDGMSFGFEVRQDNFVERAGQIIRELTDVQLHEVSTATFPAYADTALALRSYERWRSRNDDDLRAQLQVNASFLNQSGLDDAATGD